MNHVEFVPSVRATKEEMEHGTKLSYLGGGNTILGLYAWLRWSSHLPELETDGPYLDKDSDQPTGGGCMFHPGEWTSVYLMSPLPFKPHPSQICSSNGSNGLFLNQEFLRSMVLCCRDTTWQVAGGEMAAYFGVRAFRSKNYLATSS